MKQLIFKVGCLWGRLAGINSIVSRIYRLLYSGYQSVGFRRFGKRVLIEPKIPTVIGKEFITIGDGCFIDHDVQLSAWGSYENQVFSPNLIIGKNCGIGAFSHITCINSIEIGDNVLTGKNVLITDNAHGGSKLNLLGVGPHSRPLVSKGSVVIEENVWIGEKSSIMPGVRIGRGSIIAANSVVTHDIPPYCVAGGIPAKVIKDMAK